MESEEDSGKGCIDFVSVIVDESDSACSERLMEFLKVANQTDYPS